jgi:ribonuclease P protein component
MSRTEPILHHTFTVSERLKGKKLFDALFTSGQSVNKYPITAVFKEMVFRDRMPARTGFSVPKKKFKKAIDRNRLKRRMREAFRQNKHGLYDRLTKNKKQISIVFVYTGKEAVSYSDINEKIILLLKDIENQISPSSYESK